MVWPHIPLIFDELGSSFSIADWRQDLSTATTPTPIMPIKRQTLCGTHASTLYRLAHKLAAIICCFHSIEITRSDKIGDYPHQASRSNMAVDGKAKMKLADSVVRSFRVAKVFRENTDKINALDFSANGEHLISCSEDDQIVIYDCDKGTQTRTVNSKKYGVDLIHFTHSQSTAIHSSTKVDDAIRYLSLHDNKYLRYFPGHTKKVISLCISPIEDSFLSGSLDKTLRLWDLRSPNCQGVMHLTGRPIASYDPEGLIFAAGVNSESIKLYDLRSFDKGPFVTFKLNQEKECEWTGLKFSKDGKTILISTDGAIIRLIDAFHGTPLQTFTGSKHSNRSRF